MNKLIPMAGAGKRFSDAGYNTPKPLLPINDQYMVLAAAEALPSAQKNIFVCQREHILRFSLDKALAPHGSIVPIEGLSEGQACTCLAGCEYLSAEEELLIGASDNGLIYDAQLFENLRNQADVLVFGFRGDPAVLQTPKAYGWIRCNKGGKVEGVSVKKPISLEPLNDWAVVGAFYFKKTRFFIEAALDMINKNTRVNGEFYVDECINNAIAQGLIVRLMPVQHYICWGTPDDYETYLYWQNFFTKELPKYL